MTAFEKARTQARDILHQRARDERTIFYGELSEQISAMPIGAKSPEMDQLLDDISAAEARSNHGMLSAVVIRRDDQLPGDGFFKLARKLERMRSESREEFWVREVQRVYREHRR